MQFQELKDLIQQVAQSSGSSEAEITKNLADYAQMKYGANLTNAQRQVIDNAKKKLILAMYNMPNHSYVTKRPDYAGVLGLDKLEMSLLENIGTELETEGLMEGNENYTALTPSGILEAKRLNGEL